MSPVKKPVNLRENAKINDEDKESESPIRQLTEQMTLKRKNSPGIEKDGEDLVVKDADDDDDVNLSKIEDDAQAEDRPAQSELILTPMESIKFEEDKAPIPNL